MRVVVFCPSYLPSSCGGTVQAVAGVVAHLGREIDFRIFTCDRDDGAVNPYNGLQPGTWQRVGNASVYYAAPRDLAPLRMAKVVAAAKPDAYYVNSVLSPTFGVAPVMARWLGRLPYRPMIIAPRGQFHPAALRLKRFKKRAFVAVVQRLPAYADLRWQASSMEELEHIRRVRSGAKVAVARDLRPPSDQPAWSGRKKTPGVLSVAYLSRVTPMKNLLGALAMLAQVKGDVEVKVYGPTADGGYLQRCRQVARALPPHVRVGFEGEVPHERVLHTLGSHHLFLLPTLGESFGHAILDALLAGCMVITSDQTPWRGLESAGIGWDLALGDEQAYVAALQSCVEMGDDEFQAASAAARRLGMSASTNVTAIEENRALFDLLRQS